MHWATGISLAAAVASAAAAVAAVWIALRTFSRSAELQAFLVLTDRYEKIMNELPPSARTADVWTPDVDKDLALRLRYFNLCSEEFYLKQKRLLSGTVWGIWEAEMRATLASSPYLEAWQVLSHQFDSYPEFSRFVERAQRSRDDPANATSPA